MGANSKPTPVIFDHCVQVYQAMEKEAEPEDVAGTQVLVYSGHLTRLFQSQRLSMPYYSAVMRYLKSMGCVEQLRRGGGNAKSKWILRQAPNEDRFKSIVSTKTARDGWRAGIEQQLRAQQGQINELREALGLGLE